MQLIHKLTLGNRRKKKHLNTLRRIQEKQGWLSVLPVLGIVLFLRGYPLVVAVIKSFTNWDGMYKNTFVGLKNYIAILSGQQFWMFIKNTFVLMLFIPMQLFFGFVVAMLLYEKVTGWRMFRSIYYVPQVISPMIIGYLFVVIFGFNGPLNTLLRAIKLDFLAIAWLGSGKTALIVIILLLVWIDIGWQGLLVLGGLSSIPPSIFEAATIDGANYWQRLFTMTVPLLVRVIEYSCIKSVIWTFTGLFSIIHSMTHGGPGYETTTVDYMIYLKAFVIGSQLGYASALAVLLLVIVMVFTIIQMKISDKVDDWSGS
jgi:multiple sugar transport system permease protein